MILPPRSGHTKAAAAQRYERARHRKRRLFGEGLVNYSVKASSTIRRRPRQLLGEDLVNY